jgi:energy-coupling factor transport system permease protein
LERADQISNAMTLRGFGRHNSRTWYSLKPLKQVDYLCLTAIVVIVAAAIGKRLLDTALFWYPWS